MTVGILKMIFGSSSFSPFDSTTLEEVGKDKTHDSIS